MLKKAGVVIIFDNARHVREAERHIRLEGVVLLVLSVAPLCLGRPHDRRGEGGSPGKLGDIVDNAVFVNEVVFLKPLIRLPSQMKFYPRIDHRLLFQHIKIVVERNRNVGKDLKIGTPSVDRSGAAFLFRQLGDSHVADRLALSEGYLINLSVLVRADVHVFRAVLRCARAETVKSQGIFVRRRVAVVVVLAAGVKFAVDKLPVVPLFLLVPVKRHSAAEILDLDRVVGVYRHIYPVTVALTRLVNRV